MVKFKISTIINKPSNVVSQAFLEPKNIIQWMTNLEKFEVIKGKIGEVGSIAHLHYYEKSRSYIMEDRIEHCEPGKKYVSQVLSEALIVHVETIFYSVDNGTKMSLAWSGKGKLLLLKLLLPFMRKKIITQAKAELERFKELVEIYGVDFSKSLKKVIKAQDI